MSALLFCALFLLVNPQEDTWISELMRFIPAEGELGYYSMFDADNIQKLNDIKREEGIYGLEAFKNVRYGRMNAKLLQAIETFTFVHLFDGRKKILTGATIQRLEKENNIPEDLRSKNPENRLVSNFYTVYIIELTDEMGFFAEVDKLGMRERPEGVPDGVFVIKDLLPLERKQRHYATLFEQKYLLLSPNLKFLLAMKACGTGELESVCEDPEIKYFIDVSSESAGYSFSLSFKNLGEKANKFGSTTDEERKKAIKRNSSRKSTGQLATVLAYSLTTKGIQKTVTAFFVDDNTASRFVSEKKTQIDAHFDEYRLNGDVIISHKFFSDKDIARERATLNAIIEKETK